MSRNKIIDITKGIAITLMVLGHCYTKTNIVLKYIYAFHMPLFFIASGILYKEKSMAVGFSFSIRKHIKGTFVPYFVFGFLYSVCTAVLSHPDGIVVELIYDLENLITLRGVSTEWFLPCIFFAQVIFFSFFLTKRRKYRFLTLSISLLLLLVGVFSPAIIWPITIVRRILIGTGFFAVGFYAESFFNRKVILPLNICVLICFCILTSLNGNVNLVSLEFSNGLLYIINSILGSFLLIQFVAYASTLLSESKISWGGVFTLFGKNTLIILGTHMLFIEVIRLVDYKILGNFLPTLGFFEGIMLCIIVLSIERVVIPVVNRYFPFVLGK